MIYQLVHTGYIAASILFIMSLKGLSSPKTANQGFNSALLGMGIAVLATLVIPGQSFHIFLISVAILGAMIGRQIAANIEMTSLPQLVAGFHSLVGLAAVLLAFLGVLEPTALKIPLHNGIIQSQSLFEMGLGSIIGAVTFTGSIVAWGKLQGVFSSQPLTFSGRHVVNVVLILTSFAALFQFSVEPTLFWLSVVTVPALLLGFGLTLPIGGADMPVIVSMLNSYSGWAAAGIGFTLHNSLLIITGAIVGSSGAILSFIMCKGMNRSFAQVILGGFGAEESTNTSSTDSSDKTVREGNHQDAAFMLSESKSVIIVPGYGMAVAHAQHALSEIVTLLKSQGVKVKFAIHPVAGRMPGHMNVLLAEANVPYEDVFELDEVNNDFPQTDVALVLGANDVTNPSAKTDKTSPIFGMPILDVQLANMVLFIKRSLSPGYAGVDNPVFYSDNTMMVFGDAKKVCEQIFKELEAQ